MRGIILFECMSGIILLRIIFSNNFVKTGSRLIGLKDDARCLGLPDLYISVTIENFQILGKLENSMEL